MKFLKVIADFFNMLFFDASPEEMKVEDSVGMICQKLKSVESMLNDMYYRRIDVKDFNEQVKRIKEDLKNNRDSSITLQRIHNEVKSLLGAVEARNRSGKLFV